ncbi:MFS transporter [Actinacidiphila glaucinigra]|uniref:Major Facilitator Superfamily protein n=1 Tax=Actinacidiphila glaucinigra TaxID=235986 RepID=A0A238ZLC2_9ACTN|nr:MFS transporter [Actinacidiphila glaucinigra]SNR83778.1 Major Facilitator Superfamily protein [Actinacidiphila glaucinigra]
MYVADSRGGAGTEVRDASRPGPRATAVAPTVLVLGTVSLITDVSSEMVTAVLPLYLVAGLGLSPLGFGLLDGVYNGFSALVRLVGGHLADRGGGRHKAVAAVGYGLSAVCKPALLLVHSLPLIGAVLAVDRTGKGLRTAPRDALISLSSAPETRGRAFGVHRAMDTAGALLGPLVAFLILRQAAEGYDAVFTVSSCVAALGVLVLLLFVPGGRGGVPAPASGVPASADPPRPTLRASLALLRRRDVRRLTVCATLLGLSTVSDSFVYLLLQHRLGVPDRWFALLPLGTAAAFLLLAMPLGRLADRMGRWRMFLAGHVALLAAYGLLLAHGPAYAVLLLHGAFYAATDGVLMAAASTAVPDELRGAGLALVQTGQATARFAASLAFGAAWTAWGDRTALTTAALALTVCAVCAVYLRPAPSK